MLGSIRCATRPTFDTPQEHVWSSWSLKNRFAFGSPNASEEPCRAEIIDIMYDMILISE